MNTTQIIEYYQGILIKEYLGQPNAYATIGVYVEPAILPQGGNTIVTNEGVPIVTNEGAYLVDALIDTEPILPIAMQTSWALDEAQGVQLTTIGTFPIGAPRSGFDFSSAVTLNDAQYLELLNIVIARNSMAATLPAIQTFIQENFSGVMQVYDHQNMQLSYFYLDAVGYNVVAEFFIKLGMLPRPLGVSLALILPPAGNYYAFRTYAAASPSGTSGFNTYSSFQTDQPWLSYNNEIIA